VGVVEDVGGGMRGRVKRRIGTAPALGPGEILVELRSQCVEFVDSFADGRQFREGLPFRLVPPVQQQGAIEVARGLRGVAGRIGRFSGL
jgi:hypothetical protein